MAKVTQVLVASVCCMLAASVVVAVVAVIFHPSKSQAATLIKELQSEVNCAECQTRSDESSPNCEKCDSFRRRNNDETNARCDLTEDRRKQLRQVVDSQIDDTTKDRLLKILEKAVKQFPKITDEISKLNLNVPRPSAHWYNPEASSGENGSSSTRNVTSWTCRKEEGLAHSQNGIGHSQDGMMEITVPGWYHLYFQMDFRSSVQESSSYKARVFVPGKSRGEKNHHMTRHEIKRCGHTNHSCVVLGGSGTFKLGKGEKIRVQVEMPEGASLHKDKSRSYFGALYLRHAE